MANYIQSGEVYFVLLDPVVGREMGGGYERPVLVVSINMIHRVTSQVTIVPGTTKPASYWNVVQVHPTPANGLDKVTYFQCHQARSIDHSRMRDPAVGRVSDGDLTKVRQTLWRLLGWIGQ